MRKLILILCALFIFALVPGVADAQQTVFVPRCDGINDTAAFSLIITTLAGNPGTIQLPHRAVAKRCTVNTLTIPTNVTLDNTYGTGVKVNTGQLLTAQGPLVGPARGFFYNVLAGQGTISITSYGTGDVYPEWICGTTASTCASPSASAAVNTPALQAALRAAGTGRSNPSGLTIYNRRLKFSGKYQINGALVADSSIGFYWEGISKFNSGIVQTAVNTKIIDADGVAYGTIREMYFGTSVTQTNNALLDLYKDDNPDLSPQNIRFENCLFQGAGVALMGVWIARPGGGSQGDNVSFRDCYANGFTHSAVSLGGNNTAPLLNSSYAQNAINVQWTGGDIQSCPLYGLASYGGNWIVKDVTFENGNIGVSGSGPNGDDYLQTGYDLYSEANISANTVENVRSESLRFTAGNWIIRNCSVLGPAITFVNPWTALPGTEAFQGQLITGTPTGGDGKMYKVGAPSGVTAYRDINAPFSNTVITDSSASYVVNALAGHRLQLRFPNCFTNVFGTIASNTATTITLTGPLAFTPNDVSPAQACGLHTQYRTFPAQSVFGGLGDTTATGGSLTTIVKTSAGWTVDQWVGQRASIVSGTGKFQYCLVTSNTSDTITCSAGWTNDYGNYIFELFNAPLAPSSDSHFVIEPNWASNPTTTGTAQIEVVDIYAAGISNDGSSSATLHIDGFTAGGGTKIAANGQSTIRHMDATRADFWGVDLDLNDAGFFEASTIRIRKPGADQGLYMKWRLRLPTGTINAYTVNDFGQTAKHEWITYQGHSPVDGSPFRTIGIGRGGGTNHAAVEATATSLNILGTLGMLGRRTPVGLNMAGAPMQHQGGLSTGSGTPGALEFWLGSTGSSGTQVNVGSKKAWLDTSGFNLPTVKQIGFPSLTPATITGNQNNYNPGAPTHYIRLITDASRNITGLVFSPTQTDGQSHIIVNIGLQDVVIKHQDTNSSALNRFYNSTVADITLTPKQAADVLYDTTNGYWLVYKRN